MEKIQNSCSVTMLKAAEGDCLFLEFHYSSNIFSMLIDTGPMSCWESVLKPFLDDLCEKGKGIDILVITHFDADHIGGTLRLFTSDKYSGLINQVWFNGPKQIVPLATSEATQKDQQAFRILRSIHEHSMPAVDGPISIPQAESLTALLERHCKSVNSFVKGAAITCDTPSMQIAPGFSIDFILPNKYGLEALKSYIQAKTNRAVRGASMVHTVEGDAAFESVMLDEESSEDSLESISDTTLDLINIETWAACSNSKKDPSITNMSSIAICIRFYDYKFLFPGDAAGEDLVESLTQWSKLHNEPLNFDVIKMPHHGAFHNCAKLLDVIDGTYFLFSTDGRKYRHPDKETLAKITQRSPTHPRFLLFNYENDMYQLFHKKSFEERYSYRADILEKPLKIGGNNQ